MNSNETLIVSAPLHHTLTAAQDLTAGDAVLFNGTIAAAGNTIAGIAEQDTLLGDDAQLVALGIVSVTADGAIAAGDDIEVGTGGYRTRTTGAKIGRALTADSGGKFYLYVAVDGDIAGGGLTNWTEGTSTSAPNTAVPVSWFLATNTSSDVDAAIIPKGTGSLLAAVPDNSTSGGNKRGDQAVDLQLAREDATLVASGSFSVLSGGKSNKASDNFATVSGGYFNEATSQYATVSGGYGNSASDLYASVMGGSNNTASNDWAIVLGGTNSTASGINSAAIGGSGLVASGGYSVAFGIRSTSTGFAQTVVGQYNTILPTSASGSFTVSDPAFIVGNGDGSSQAARSYAMMVTFDAKMYLGGRWSTSDATGTQSKTGEMNFGFANNTTFAKVRSESHSATRTYTLKDMGQGGYISIFTPTPPAAATDFGVPGMWSYDSDYHYLCVAPNTWKRSPLTTW